MDSKKALSASSRVKACTECRQHKLRCDATKDHSAPCSRCRRRGLHCEITTAFRRSKRRTKKDLQAELESLRQQVETAGSSSTPLTYVGASSTGPQHSNSSVPSPASLTLTNSGSTAPNLATVESVERPKLGQRLLTASSMPTLSRRIGDLEVSSQAIDACFDLFLRRYLPYVPLSEGKTVKPNLTWLQSELLFWTILAVGSRKYHEDPTILTSLESHITDLTNRAILSRENPLPVIKALILLCTWPLPHDSLNKDPSPILAGALLNHALSIGLHIRGVGQDFSRTKVAVDRAQIDYRRRLWFLCVTACQRVSCTNGIPPPLVPDTYSRDAIENQEDAPLPANMVFEKILSGVQTEGIMQLERTSLVTPSKQRAAVLNPIIDTIMGQLLELLVQSPSDISTLYTQAAQLQVLCFHLFVPREHLEDSKLLRMYELGCLCIETAQRIELDQGISDCAPIFISKYLDMAALTILKISRCHLSQALDLERGRRAYFFVINFCRNVSIQGGDVMSRSEGILTQLWASKNIFKRSDGTFDSLTLRCGSRLAMSVLYDCLWWWRTEFAGLQNPYDDNQTPTNVLPPEQVQQEMISPALDPFNDPAALDFIFPESQWATSHDLLSLDWSQLQYDNMLPFVDVDTGAFDTGGMLMPDPTLFQPLAQQV